MTMLTVDLKRMRKRKKSLNVAEIKSKMQARTSQKNTINAVIHENNFAKWHVEGDKAVSLTRQPLNT